MNTDIHSDALYYDTLASPVGPLRLIADELGLRRICFQRERHARPEDGLGQHAPSKLAFARTQLEEYFSGTRRAFDLPLRPRGTPFQLSVWEALCAIPYGDTWSYADLAAHIGKPSAMRAVGAANGRNPLPIVVPCHRVIGRDGSLVGFGGGLEIKARLLALERRPGDRFDAGTSARAAG